MTTPTTLDELENEARLWLLIRTGATDIADAAGLIAEYAREYDGTDEPIPAEVLRTRRQAVATLSALRKIVQAF
jgi:hypothetical protein